METISKRLPFVSVLLSILFSIRTWVVVVEANWCVARSDASNQALQTSLDYACASGADCTPIESNGLCFLPNTIQAHASYAFNSYFQRKAMAPGSCDFSHTATIAATDPSYGSCVYPSSSSTAGGTTTGTTPTTGATNPTTLTPPTSVGTNGLNPTGRTPPLTTDNSKASSGSMTMMILVLISCLYVLLFAH
ncbi:hypothetical protein K2173_019336 [Erythroxylum novogranatense]|uniref:X8 domain-containing protein n=1 Tax=Erythroxylum novogranatense TaxID=1862640 RepID=A0AAV8SUC2_9ROSI|nr:hypothetical protein K2173_019336 [Erythroxylum novogranatense]